MAWLVVYLDGYCGIVIGIGEAGVWIHVGCKLPGIALLRFDCIGVGVDVALGVVVGVCAGVDVALGVAVAEVGLCGEYYGDSALFEF